MTSLGHSDLDSSNLYSMNNRLRKQKDRSYRSPDGEKRYFLGIIDTLTIFNWRKRGESFFKRIFVSKNVSAIAPIQYQFRFYRFFKDAVETYDDVLVSQILRTEKSGLTPDSNSVRQVGHSQGT